MRKRCAGTAALPSRDNAVAQYNLGVMYENGRGVRRDRVEAVRWYRLAAEQEYANAQKALDRLR